MFTLEQIESAHSKVKSGADFPAYVQDLKNMGVNAYEIYVEDGKEIYLDQRGNILSSTAKYEKKIIHPTLNLERFKLDLKRHQKGESDYMQFIEDCAASGIVKWKMDIIKMTCTYFDIQDVEVMTEQIPS